nr:MULTISPECIES: RNA-guided endonuclease TnpB family protein [unclassified Exiguobacterium]
MSRKKAGSRNREKARLILAKRHEKIANQCKDFLHKLSRRIVDENQVIVVETLKLKHMMKGHKVAKSIGDVSWYEFVRQLEYKCTFYGRTLIRADPWYASTQICSSCGEKGQKKTMDVRRMDMCLGRSS